MRSGSSAAFIRGCLCGGLFMGSLIGCDSGSSGPPPTQTLPKSIKVKVVVAFVGRANDDPLWPVLEHGAQQYADTWSAEILAVAPDEATVEAQTALLESLDMNRFNGLCIHAVDADRMRPEIERIRGRGVNIVSMVERLDPGVAAGHVGFDDLAIGTALAKETARALDGDGNVMLLHAGLDRTDMTLRLSGFSREIDQHTGVAVLAEEDCGADPARARGIIRDKMARYPNLAAWVALDDWPVRGVDADDAVLPDNTRLITWSMRPSNWPLVRNGTIRAMVTADCGELGATALRFCSNVIRDATTPEQYYQAPLRVVVPGNLEAFIRDWRRWTGASDVDPAGRSQD